MLKSYFKVAIRNFLRDRTYSLINLVGLVIGMAAVFMILGYVRYELSYDQHYSNSNRVYRLISRKTKSNNEDRAALVLQPLAYTLKNEFPEIESVSFLQKGEDQFLLNNEMIKLNTIHADSSFLHIFNIPLQYGTGIAALTHENDIVITEKVSHTFFPGRNSIGLNLQSKDWLGKNISFKITGIIKEIPGNTHFKAEAIIANIQKQQPLDWSGGNVMTEYILLKKNTSAGNLEQKFPFMLKKYNCPDNIKLELQPVKSIHLHSSISDEPFANSNIKYIYIFSFVALLILLIACINYINLTTARSLQRIREVGVRKVMGAQRKQLVFQFITESVLFFCCALPIAFLLSYSLWPIFIQTINIPAENNYLFHGKFIIAIVGIGLLTGILSGSYPAFFLSKMRPAHILKDWQKSFRLNMNIRKGLIIFQFVISITLIISTLVIYLQLHFMNNMELGFNKNYLIALPWQMMENKTDAFKYELKKNKNITNVAISSWKAGEYYGSYGSIHPPHDTTKELNLSSLDGDYDFLKTMGIELVQGRDFSPAYGADAINNDSLFKILSAKKLSRDEINNMLSSQSIIITEQAAKALQLKQPLAGQVLNYKGLRGTVIGEVKNFLGISLLHQNSMVVITSGAKMRAGFTYIRIFPGNISQTISFIQSTWKNFFPNNRFEFSFVDDRLQQSYDAQSRLASIFNFFGLLAIIIAAMGLFSLVALTVQQKTKEIGIRKVLGASISEIVQLLSKDFLKLILVAILIASPIGWWAMHRWLEDFNYRISISWWIFFIAGTGCLCFAIAIVVIQAMRAATANPVKSLRTE